MANAVLTMFQDKAQNVEERARELNDRQFVVDEARIAWNAIKSLEENEGWQELVKLTQAMIETQRARIVDGNIEDQQFARGELKALQWFVQSPSIAEAHLIAVKQAQEALADEQQHFVAEGE